MSVSEQIFRDIAVAARRNGRKIRRLPRYLVSNRDVCVDFQTAGDDIKESPVFQAQNEFFDIAKLASDAAKLWLIARPKQAASVRASTRAEFPHGRAIGACKLLQGGSVARTRSADGTPKKPVRDWNSAV